MSSRTSGPGSTIRLRAGSDILNRVDLFLAESLARLLQQVRHLPFDQCANDSRLDLVRSDRAMALFDPLQARRQKSTALKILERDQANAEGVVHVVSVVSEAVGDIDDLRL